MDNSTDILQRLSVVETDIKSMLVSLEYLKRGIGVRTEKHGEDIAVIKEKIDNKVSVADFKTLNDSIVTIRHIGKMIIASVVGTYLMQMYQLVMKK